jgi:putative salt-induced outer membrane protein
MKPAASAAAFVILTCAAGSAGADWSGKGKLGGVLTRGNTKTTTLSADADVQNVLDRWKHKFGGSVLRALSEDELTADRWELRAGSEYTPTDRAFSFVTARYEDDAFTDFEYQVTGAIGLGYHFFQSPETKLDVTIGVGARATELRSTGEAEREDILRGSMEFQHALTETAKVFDRYLVESGSTNTFSQNTLGIEVKVNGSLALGLGYEVRRNSHVVPGTRNSDQVYTANVVYSFGQAP